uniref:Uncharacterized protein n=1 Tax=Arundo donax TaxID=35708 RepID=A0A0A9GRJ9_ARUDO
MQESSKLYNMVDGISEGLGISRLRVWRLKGIFGSFANGN